MSCFQYHSVIIEAEFLKNWNNIHHENLHLHLSYEISYIKKIENGISRVFLRYRTILLLTQE